MELTCVAATVVDQLAQTLVSHSGLVFPVWGEGICIVPLLLIHAVISDSLSRGTIKPVPQHHWRPCDTLE